MQIARNPLMRQILLDVQAVKACLLDLPEPHPENATNAYTKYVTKNTGQLETMLKVILAPDASQASNADSDTDRSLGSPRRLCPELLPAHRRSIVQQLSEGQPALGNTSQS